MSEADLNIAPLLPTVPRWTITANRAVDRLPLSRPVYIRDNPLIFFEGVFGPGSGPAPNDLREVVVRTPPGFKPVVTFTFREIVKYEIEDPAWVDDYGAVVKVKFTARELESIWESDAINSSE